MTPEFKRAVEEVREEDWQPLHPSVAGREVETKVEWAEVCYVPNAIGHSKKGPEYRYVATREVMMDQELPGLESQQELPFQTLRMEGVRYKVFGIVTNMDWEGERLVHWLHERCGKSEEVHAVLKHDLAAAHLPAHCFGANAAWWWASVLSHNLNAIMKRQVLGSGFIQKRLKAIRFFLINLSGRVLEHARYLLIRLTPWQPMAELLIEMRRRIASRVAVPAG